MVRFSLAARDPQKTWNLLANLGSVSCLASLCCLSQNKMIFFSNQVLQTHKYFESLSLLSTCYTQTFIFSHLFFHFIFSHSRNTFSCHYLSFKILSTKISNLTLLSNFDGTDRKRLQNVKQKYSIQVLEHFIFIFSKTTAFNHN